jgi:23S rRNA (uracil1939-C5)-methyltransferase
MLNTRFSNSEPVDVTVGSLGGLGDGIATYQNKPLFIPKACAGDRVRVRITHETKDAFQGRIVEVLEPGPDRRNAPCMYFDACGGCALQQLTETSYRNFKRRMLHNSLSQAGFPMPGAEVTFIAPASRRRVEFKAHCVDGTVEMAFYDLRSHSPVVIGQCPVILPELEAFISPLNRELSAMPLASRLHAVSLTRADHGIEMVLTLKNDDVHTLPGLEALCKALGLARISVCTPDSIPRVVVQLAPVEMILGNYRIDLPPDAFLQATAEGQVLLTDIVLKASQGASRVIDLFCGIGTYSFPLSRIANTRALEGDAAMAQAMRKQIRHHGIATLAAEQRDLFKNPVTAKELAQYDVAVLNPPRAGARAQTLQLAASTVSAVVMISCNPATFARDMKVLKQSGFLLESVLGIDQFVWSPHLEIAAVLKRSHDG